jgi:hypothetical protein
MPGESWDRCKAVKLAGGSWGYCSRNVENRCPEYKQTINPLRRWAVHGKWWRPYM